MSNLSDDRRRILEQQRSISLAKDGLIDLLLLTKFCDKKQLVIKRYQRQRSKTALKSGLNKIERLRDFVAHANDYAASPEQATEVCTVVRNLVELRGEISGSVVGAA